MRRRGSGWRRQGWDFKSVGEASGWAAKGLKGAARGKLESRQRLEG